MPGRLSSPLPGAGRRPDVVVPATRASALLALGSAASEPLSPVGTWIAPLAPVPRWGAPDVEHRRRTTGGEQQA